MTPLTLDLKCVWSCPPSCLEQVIFGCRKTGGLGTGLGWDHPEGQAEMGSAGGALGPGNSGDLITSLQCMLHLPSTDCFGVLRAGIPRAEIRRDFCVWPLC